MRSFAKAGLVAGAAALLVGTLALPAHAAPRPTGTLCGILTSDAETPGVQSGVLFGGPVVLRDDTNPAVVYSGTLTCTYQHGFFNDTHADANTCSATSPTATGITTAVAPTPCTFPGTGGAVDSGYVCAQVNISSGPTLYWAHGSPLGTWSTSAASPCTPVGIQTVNDQLVTTLLKDLLDSILCPILTPFFPPHGDVGIFYDCPPYSTPAPPPAFERVVYVIPPQVGF